MTRYRNFTVDLPSRLSEMDRHFALIAKSMDLEVSYLLMKLGAAFLLPYERTKGTSGARTSDIQDTQAIRKYLELDKRFSDSTYCKDKDMVTWCAFEVDDFSHGPRAWEGMQQPLKKMVHEVLKTLRHAVAHSNLYFDGETKIEHFFFGNRQEQIRDTDKYLVIRCTVSDMRLLLDSWITNLQKVRVSPSLIWDELDNAA